MSADLKRARDAAVDAFYDSQPHCGASDCDPEPYVLAAVDAALSIANAELEQAAQDLVKHAVRAPARMNATEDRPSGEVIVVRPETFYALQNALKAKDEQWPTS